MGEILTPSERRSLQGLRSPHWLRALAYLNQVIRFQLNVKKGHFQASCPRCGCYGQVGGTCSGVGNTWGHQADELHPLGRMFGPAKGTRVKYIFRNALTGRI